MNMIYNHSINFLWQAIQAKILAGCGFEEINEHVSFLEHLEGGGMAGWRDGEMGGSGWIRVAWQRLTSEDKWWLHGLETSSLGGAPALASTRQHSPLAVCRGRCSYSQPRSLEQCSVSWRVRMCLLVLLGKIWYRSTCVEMSYDRKYHEEYEVSWHIAMWPMASLRHTNGQVPARTYPSTAILQRI